jgi:hypothetical protein
MLVFSKRSFPFTRQTFGMADIEMPTRRQKISVANPDPCLGGFIKIDDNVAAEDDIKWDLGTAIAPSD